MTSRIGWIEISGAALGRLRRELAGESDGVVDEMGVGALHSGYADHFFPGTSVLQKRPRYLFFTCWNFLRLSEFDSAAPPLERKELAEAWVRDQLRKAKQKNIIGARVERPAQPVDFIYWTALKSWGFYRGVNRSTLVHQWDVIVPRRVDATRELNPEAITEEPAAAFFVKAPPRYWLRQRPGEDITFDLQRDEAEFLQKRLESLPPCVLSEAAVLARASGPNGESVWTDDVIREAARCRGETAMVERARRASSLALVVRATYAALVEQRRNETAASTQMAAVKDRDHYVKKLAEIAAGTHSERETVLGLNLDSLREDIPRPDGTLFRLFDHVRDRLTRVRKVSDVESVMLDAATMKAFCAAEVRRKGLRRARLTNSVNGLARRIGFTEKTLTVSGIDYRWATVRMLLRDLHAGLNR